MTESNEPQFPQNMAEAQGAEKTPKVSRQQRQQNIRKELAEIAQKGSDNLSLGEIERDAARREELTQELLQLEQMLKPMEISREDLRLSQTMYDQLGLKINGSPINLEQELSQKNILFPAKEQQELAEKEGLTQILIIPGQIKRQDFLKYFKGENYQNNFDCNDLHIIDPAPKDLTKSEAIKNPKRPKQFYAILVSPQISCHTAHPETQGQPAQQCMDILTQKQTINPNLNLTGLTLEEYLLLDCLIYLKDNQKQHLEPKTWCWLLEEGVLENNSLARCLGAAFYPDARSVEVDGVDSGDFSNSSSADGARFAAVSRPR